MGFFDRFKKKRKAENNSTGNGVTGSAVNQNGTGSTTETTESNEIRQMMGVAKDGTHIYKYQEENQRVQPLALEEGKYADEVNEHFAKIFPESETFVYHELVSELVHVDVNVMLPTEKRNFYVVYTTGMSDLPMTPPKGFEDREDLKYAEIFAFMPPTWNPKKETQSKADGQESEYWLIQMMKYMARFPHRYGTWLANGHTIPNGPNYDPIAAGTKMGGVIMKQLGRDFECVNTQDGKKINLLMLIPAYREEIEFKLKNGLEKLDEIYAEHDLPLVIDVNRPNYCEQ